MVKWRKLIIKVAVWSIAEIIFNLGGIDDLVDYSEFIFEQDFTEREKQIILIENAIMTNRKNSRFGKKKLPDPQEILAKSRNSNVLRFFPHRKTQSKKSVSPNKEKFQINGDEQLHIRQIIVNLAKTLIPQLLPKIALCSGYSFLIVMLNHWGLLPEIFASQAIANTVIGLTLTLGLLLTFKINGDRDRLELGRKLFGAMAIVVRNTVRGISLYIREHEPQDRYEKESAMQLVSAFAVATKLHLRNRPITEIKPLVSQLEYKRLQVSNHAPLDITLWIGDYLQRQYEQEQLDSFQLSDLQSCINELVNILGDCERILKTSVSSINTTALRVLSLAYLIIFPIGMVGGLGWGTIFVTTFVSAICLFANEIRARIEKPFGNAHSDLYLNFICDNIQRNIDDLIQQASHSHSQPRKIVNLPKKAA